MVILAPGPDILMVIARGMSLGRSAGFAAALGFVSGLPLHIALVAYGFAWLLQQYPSVASVIQWAGALYIGYLAWRLWRARDVNLSTQAPDQRRTTISIYFQCIIMNLLNPKVALFFWFFLPQFVQKGSETVKRDIFVLGGIFMILTVLIFGAAAVIAGTLGNFLRARPAIARWLNRGVSILFFALAIWLILPKSWFSGGQ